MEIHGLDRLNDRRFLDLSFMPLMANLASVFDLVHIHANNCLQAAALHGGYHLQPILELTYLRKDRNQGQQIPAELPHPLDILNIPQNPTISINDYIH